MSSAVPEGWQVSQLGSLATVNWGNTSLTKDSYAETGFPAYSAAGNDGLVPNAEHNDVGVVLSAIGARCGRTFLTPKRWTAIKNTITILSDNQDIRFLYQVFNFNEVWNKSGGAQPFISLGDARKTPILTPPLPEQKKIASILTSVDEVIENTQKKIDKLQDLKKATMNELLTKGIGHTEFKDSELGRIPKSWEVRPYSELVTVEMHPISLKDHSYYAPVVVRRRHNGVETRGEKLGSSILVKIQYEALPNTFLISKRQIFHGSCGIVPKDIGANAIISKEYLSLKTNESMDLRFLNYFSRTENFQNQIVRTTYGVDEEKFVFKDQWWMKEKIVCPSKEEQINICNVVDGIEAHLNTAELKLTQTQSLKKSLMQDLLTGKVRVTVN